MDLKKLYDKKYIVSIYELLKHIGQKEKNKYYDPAFDTYTIINKQQAFLDCWRQYFKILMPLYTKQNKKELKKNINTIHLIFGNEVSQIINMLYGNALFFRVGIKTLQSNISKYKEYDQNK